MGIIAWIVLGLPAGTIARALLPGGDSIGMIAGHDHRNPLTH